MRITFDPAKRVRTLAERGLDFEDACGAHRCSWLHAAWFGSSRIQHEESQ
jgi:uncharacterized DUF497 family protein